MSEITAPMGGKIIDVGCGPGNDTGFMTSKGFEVIGIDLSKEMLNIARQKFPKINFKQQDIRELDFPANSFEGIFASFSLIHIPKKDISVILNKFYKILKRDGVIYIGLQTGKSEEGFIDEPFKPGEKLFMNIISFEELKNLLIENGFSIVKKYERDPKPGERNYTKLYVIAKK